MLHGVALAKVCLQIFLEYTNPTKVNQYMHLVL